MAWTDAARAASLATRRAHAKKVTVYHGTTYARALQIKQRGFRPVRVKKFTNIGDTYESPYNATYFALQKSIARAYALNAASNMAVRTRVGKRTHSLKFPAAPAIVAVRLPKYRLHKDLVPGNPGQYWARGVSKYRVRSVSKLRIPKAWTKARYSNKPQYWTR